MTVIVWTMPSPQLPVSIPLTYKAGESTKIDGACLNVLDDAGRAVSVWGSGAWQRAEVS